LLGDGPDVDEEPTPLAPPQIDDATPLDLPAGETSDDPLAGDLRIDLSSLSGFTFSTEESETETEAETDIGADAESEAIDSAWDAAATDIETPVFEPESELGTVELTEATAEEIL